MDGTRNPKLDALEAAFRGQKGEVYIGDRAWAHLESLAGSTMAAFLERYVRGPIQSLLSEGEKPMRDLTAKVHPNIIEIGLGEEVLRINRQADSSIADSDDEMPDDADDVIPGA